MMLNRCPQMEITSATVRFIRIADMAKKGALPVAGGSLDQSESWMAAYLWWLQWEGKCEAERGAYQGRGNDDDD
jgi:hypothetical protein